MTEPIGFTMNDIDYCMAHRPTSRLADLQGRYVTEQPLTGPKRKCYVCGVTL